jgi:predicted DNA-binding transcriptional regulator AlpA
MSTSPAPSVPVAERHGDTLLSIDDFCSWTRISKRTFNQWCQDGTAPRRLKIGRHIRIRWSDALAWAESRYVTSD